MSLQNHACLVSHPLLHTNTKHVYLTKHCSLSPPHMQFHNVASRNTHKDTELVSLTKSQIFLINFTAHAKRNQEHLLGYPQIRIIRQHCIKIKACVTINSCTSKTYARTCQERFQYIVTALV